MPPPRAAAAPTKTTPKTSSRLATAADPPEAAKTATPTRSAMSRAVAVPHRRRVAPAGLLPVRHLLVVLVDLLALRADREALGVARGDPHFAAQGPDGRPQHHRLGDLVRLGVVGEPLVIALLDP